MVSKTYHLKLPSILPVKNSFYFKRPKKKTPEKTQDKDHVVEVRALITNAIRSRAYIYTYI